MSVAQTIVGYYESLLFRTPSPAEVAVWENAVNNGTSLEAVKETFISSPEANQYITPLIRLYQAAFGRLPDNAGLNSWADAMRAGMTFEQVANGFIGSQEFTNIYGTDPASARGAFLTKLYENVLGRVPDTDGYNTWLNSGASITDLLIGFVNSPEFVAGSADEILDVLHDLADGQQLDPSKPLVDYPPIDPGPGPGPGPGPDPDPHSAFRLENGVLHLTDAGNYVFEETDTGIAVKFGGETYNVPTGSDIKTFHLATNARANVPAEIVDEAADIAFIGTGTVDFTGVTLKDAKANSGNAEVSADLSEFSSLGSVNYTVDGSFVKFIESKWTALDDAYTYLANHAGEHGAVNYENANEIAGGREFLGASTVGEAALAINKAFVDLGVEYATYLEANHTAITDFYAKYTDTRQQTIHDNLLGNLASASLQQRGLTDYFNETKDYDSGPAGAFTGRPYYDGILTHTADYDATRIFDYQRDIQRPDYVDSYVGQLAEIGRNANGEAYFGDGNPTTNWTITKHVGEGIELGFNAHYRTGDQIMVSADGKFHVPSGPQVVDPEHNVSSAHAGRAAWNLDYSQIVNLNGDGKTFDDYVSKLSVDVDPTAGISYRVFELKKFGSVYAFVPEGTEGAQALAEAIGTGDKLPASLQGLVAQDSMNFGFGTFKNYIDADPETDGIQPYQFGPGEFDFRLDVSDMANVAIVGIHATVVVDAPAV